MAKIKIIQLDNETIFPATHIDAVYDDDGNKLSDILKDSIMQGPQGEKGEQGIQSPGVKMIAHRGYNVDIPENSIPAFESAGLRGYWGAECDVIQTSDGHFVLMHDDTIDRTTNGSGSVKELTLEEIKSYSIDTHAKFNGLKVPTLEEYIICCKRYNLIPIMEIKGDINVEQFYQIIKNYNIEDKCVVISFSNYALESLRSLSSIIKIQTLSFVSFEHCIKYNFDIDIDKNIVTSDFIKNAHDMGLKVNVWTVNADMNNYIDMGVDYITTDSLSTRTNVGNRLVAIEEDANCNNAVSNTLSYLGKDMSTSNELSIRKLYHGNRSWNKAIYYYPDDFYKVSYNSVRLISDIYSHRGYSTCSLVYDDSKYKVALYFFDMSDSHLLKDSGWLLSNVEYKLDDTDSYFTLFIARVDSATFTESDINELKSNLKVVFDKDSSLKSYVDNKIADISKKSVDVIIDDNNVNIISSFSDTSKIAYKINVGPDGRNNVVNFDTVSLIDNDGHTESIYSTTDDSSPIRTQFGYIGGNHGHLGFTLKSSGQTQEDVGSIWTDGTTDYVLAKVQDDKCYFAYNQYRLASGKLMYNKKDANANLTPKSGATNTNSLDISTRVTSVQLYPSINRHSIEYYFDDKKVVTPSGSYECDKFVIKEQYNVMKFDAMHEFLTTHIGSSLNDDTIEGFATFTITYEFTKGCKCNIYHSLEALDVIELTNTGFIQQSYGFNSNYTVSKIIPGVGTVDNFNFSAGVNLKNITKEINICRNNLINEDASLSRDVNIAYKESIPQFIFTNGYLIDKTDSAKRKDYINEDLCLWKISSNKKTYPIAVNGMTLNEGDYLSFSMYRNFNPIHDNVTSFNTIKNGKDIYFMVDNLDSVATNIVLDEYIGERLEILESNNFELLSDTIDSNGLCFRGTDVSYAILKIIKDVDKASEEINSLKEDMTQNGISNNVLTLTKDKYQECEILDGTEIVLPTLDTYKEIHLFFTTTGDISIVMPEGILYQKVPTIVANKTYEFIFTYTNTSIGWVFGYIEYTQ
jgi:glycerophosphoryl diester phosphodiesterase